MDNIVNTKHDANSYDCFCYEHEIFNCDALFEGYLKARKASSFKNETQKFEQHYLMNLAHMYNELCNETYCPKPTKNFVISERGRTRVITCESLEDKIVKHILCDNILNPCVRKYLIYDNGAGLKDKGISFTRRRLETHLHKYYMKHDSNKGYILLFDFSKYYDNIRHDILKSLLTKYVSNMDALKWCFMYIDQSAISIDCDNENEGINTLYNSLDHINEHFSNNSKTLPKHLNVGDQLAQTAGTLYATPIDNYIKIVKGCKYYARYNDDGYIIHESKNYLMELQKELDAKCKELGITLNKKKTRIVKLDSFWRFLQIQYSLTDSGRVIHKINPKRLTKMREKMKNLAPKMKKTDFTNWYRSWIKNNVKYMSKLQRKNSDELFNKLLEVTQHD